MKVNDLLIILSASLIPIVAFGEQTPIPVAKKGETHIVSTKDNVTVQVSIDTREVNIGKPSDPRPEVIKNNCTYSEYPCSVVDWVGIKVNGDSIIVPGSVFADLSDLNIAKIIKITNGWNLILNGGDASESYIVTIEFDKVRVKRRTLASATEPNQPLQETKYNLVTVGDD
jgi:hypothetical protein